MRRAQMFLVRVKVSSLNIKRDHFLLVLTKKNKRNLDKGKKIVGFFMVGK